MRRQMLCQNENTQQSIHVKKLYDFMNKYRINKTDKMRPTHGSMNPAFLGTFAIPIEKKSQFDLLYCSVIKSKYIPSILEYHLDQGPIIIDIDMKYTINNNVSPRIYTDSIIKKIIEIYNGTISTFISLHDEDLNAYIFEKNEPKIISKDDINMKISYKDGIHIVYPFICVDNKVQYFIRELVIQKIKKNNIFQNFVFDNSIDDIFDKAVIENNNWLMYGSCKTNNINHVYKLSYIIDIHLQKINNNDDINELVNDLSIRKFNSSDINPYCKEFNLEKIMILYNEMTQKNINKKIRPLAHKDDIEDAKKLILLLSNKRASSYMTWIEVGFCLHNIDDGLLEEWIEFSKSVPSLYKEGECEKLWNNFRYEGLGVGSLYRWAKEDNPAKYSDFMLDRISDLIKYSLKSDSYSIAKVFYEYNKYQYVCASIKNKLWYEFKNHKWSRMDEATDIINKLNEDLANEYIKVSVAFNQKALTETTNETKQNLIEKSKAAMSIVSKIHGMKFKKEIIAELLHLYYDSTFLSKLDENRYLFGFKNGIYDLKNHEFRHGRPEDYVSMSCNCNYMPFDENNQQIIEVYKFFNDIQHEEPIRNYVLLKLSSLLEGVQRDQKFEIWIGTGANGKGRILKLLLDSFGDYGATIPITLLTRQRSDSNSATPAMANTKGKRVCVFQEPENDDCIYVGHMKNLTGGDKMMARSLYCDPIEFYPQFKTILACNKLPLIPSTDNGTWRRIRVVPFETKFVDNPKAANERQKVNNIDDLICDWKSAFLSILIEKYREYIKYGIHEPEKVLKYTTKYQKDSDIYMEFICYALVKSTMDDYISIDELFNEFKKWNKEKKGDKKPVRNDAKEELEMRISNVSNGYAYGYRYKTCEDETKFQTKLPNSPFLTDYIN